MPTFFHKPWARCLQLAGIKVEQAKKYLNSNVYTKNCPGPAWEALASAGIRQPRPDYQTNTDGNTRLFKPERNNNWKSKVAVKAGLYPTKNRKFQNRIKLNWFKPNSINNCPGKSELGRCYYNNKRRKVFQGLNIGRTRKRSNEDILRRSKISPLVVSFSFTQAL